MTREEEIKQAIKDICGCSYCEFDKKYCHCCKERNVTIEAINWADQYPREGLWDAEKVIKWMDKYADSYTYYDVDKDETGFIGQMFEDLRKAMVS